MGRSTSRNTVEGLEAQAEADQRASALSAELSGRSPRPWTPRAQPPTGTNGASSGGASVGNLAAEAARALGAREEALRAREAEHEAREAKLHAERITLRATVTPTDLP